MWKEPMNKNTRYLLADLKQLEAEIAKGLEELEGMLND